MAIHIFTVPFDPAKQVFEDEELRAFLLNKRVTALRPEFFQDNCQAYWSVFVEYEPVLPSGLRAIEGLTEPQSLLFRRFQAWRKEQAEKEGIPSYIIATNKQLAEVVRTAPRTLEALRQIRGFGKKKLEKYGDEMIKMIMAFYDQHTTARPSGSHPSGSKRKNAQAA